MANSMVLTIGLMVNFITGQLFVPFLRLVSFPSSKPSTMTFFRLLLALLSSMKLKE